MKPTLRSKPAARTATTPPAPAAPARPVSRRAARALIAVAIVVLAAAVFSLYTTTANAADDVKPAAPVRAALNVVVTQAERTTLPLRVQANGNVAAWQEASVGTEANGLRLAEVKVNVGDVVKKNQVLATFAPDTINADVAQVRASVAEGEANLAEASANAQRARELEKSGALSAQQINQYLTAETTAKARLAAQRALASTQALRLRQTQVLAPDDGVISARTATVGAVLPAGTELFRMIRRGRLEWRAEVPAVDLVRVKPGMAATLDVGGVNVAGKVRMLSPVVDPQTRNGLAYVDLPAPGALRAGMFARGTIDIGNSDALTLPQSAVLLREGFSYVLRVGADARLSQVKVTTGRRVGDRVEVLSGLDAGAKVVATGGGFLGDGDVVRVVPAVK